MIAVGFSTTDQWISRLVRWFTDSDVSHAFILFYDATLDELLVLDVAWAGYRVIPWKTFLETNRVVALFQTDVDMKPGIKAVVRWLGMPYDWKAFVRFWRWSKIFLRHPVANQKALLCTEVVVHALQIAGYPGADKLSPKDTTPKMLREFLAATARALPCDSTPVFGGGPPSEL